VRVEVEGEQPEVNAFLAAIEERMVASCATSNVRASGARPSSVGSPSDEETR